MTKSCEGLNQETFGFLASSRSRLRSAACRAFHARYASMSSGLFSVRSSAGRELRMRSSSDCVRGGNRSSSLCFLGGLFIVRDGAEDVLEDDEEFEIVASGRILLV